MNASAISPEQMLLLQKENAELRGEIGQLTARCAELQAKLALLLKKYFGGGQGETLDQAQLLLAIDGLKKEIAAGHPAERDDHLRAPEWSRSEAYAASRELRAPAGQRDDRDFTSRR